MSGLCVIGVGHPDRGDDAVGRIVAARLRKRAPHLTVFDLDGEATALMQRFDGVDAAILIDAALSDSEPGTIRRFDAARSPLPALKPGMSTHGFGLGEAIELARALGSLPKQCIVFAIEAANFETGDPLSPEVAGAIDVVVERVMAEVGAHANA